MSRQLDNANPTIFASSAPSSSRRQKSGKALLWDDQVDEFAPYLSSDGEVKEEREEIDAEEVYGELANAHSDHRGVAALRRDLELMIDLLRSITDPEHPVSLEQLRVVNPEDVHVSGNRVLVFLTPTIPHCSMSTLIGLSLRVRLMRSLPPRFRVDIRIKEGTHQSEHAVNKQLNDKERVHAALENSHLLQVVEGCLATAGKRGKAEVQVEGGIPA